VKASELALSVNGKTVQLFQGIIGTAGNDSIPGSEFPVNTSSSDTILGLEGDDTLDGGNGNDLIIGGLGNDSVLGGDGSDTIVAGEGNDTIDGGGVGYDIDTVRYDFSLSAAGIRFEVIGLDSKGGGTQAHPGGTDTLLGIEQIEVLGGSGNDTLDGSLSTAFLILRGGDGDDILKGRGFAILSGGAGNDTLEGINNSGQHDSFNSVYANYDDASGSVVINLATGTVSGTSGNDTIFSGVATGAAGNDTLINIYNAIGTKFNDSISGSAAANALLGGIGNDTIDGGGGSDRIDGSLGSDSLLGGSGKDTFDYFLGGYHSDSAAETDIIADFSGTDQDAITFQFSGGSGFSSSANALIAIDTSFLGANANAQSLAPTSLLSTLDKQILLVKRDNVTGTADDTIELFIDRNGQSGWQETGSPGTSVSGGYSSDLRIELQEASQLHPAGFRLEASPSTPPYYSLRYDNLVLPGASEDLPLEITYDSLVNAYARIGGTSLNTEPLSFLVWSVDSGSLQSKAENGDWIAFDPSTSSMFNGGQDSVRWIPAENANGTGGQAITAFRVFVPNGSYIAYEPLLVKVEVSQVNDPPVAVGQLPPAIQVERNSLNDRSQQLGLSSLSFGPGGGSDESDQSLVYTLTGIPSFVKIVATLGGYETEIRVNEELSASSFNSLALQTRPNQSGNGLLDFKVSEYSYADGSLISPSLSVSSSLSIQVL